MRMKLGLVGSGVCCGLLLAGAANAQDGYAINRFEPADRGSDWFVGDSLDFRGDLRPVVGVTGDWSYKPLVWYRDGEEHRSIIRHQVFAHVGAAVVLQERLRLGFTLPVRAYQKASPGTFDGTVLDPAEGPGVGDLRLSAALRILGEYGSPVSLAAGVWGHVPTGKQDAFSGDGKLRIGPHVMLAGDVGPLAYAARLGATYRRQTGDIAGGKLGSEVFGSASIGLRLADQWLVGPEVWSSTNVSNKEDLFELRSTPVEGLLGAHYIPNDQWKFSLGGGPGLTRGFGAPKWRTVASVEWSLGVSKPPPPPLDSDGDGILDRDDACPEVPGVATDDPATHGCPEVEPPPDSDGDGILDADDACPDEPGIASDDPEKHGCPVRDRDGDGILDADDACPDEPGPENEDPKKHGCPKVVVNHDEIKILDRVEFETGKATLLPSAEEILEAVRAVLDEYSDISKVSVDGHTDSRGNDAFNQRLSERRAASVVKWLVSHGIEASRLTSQGFGESRPIDDNDTEEGRQNNRRVQFRILEQKTDDPPEEQ